MGIEGRGSQPNRRSSPSRCCPSAPSRAGSVEACSRSAAPGRRPQPGSRLAAGHPGGAWFCPGGGRRKVSGAGGSTPVPARGSGGGVGRGGVGRGGVGGGGGGGGGAGGGGRG